MFGVSVCTNGGILPVQLKRNANKGVDGGSVQAIVIILGSWYRLDLEVIQVEFGQHLLPLLLHAVLPRRLLADTGVASFDPRRHELKETRHTTKHTFVRHEITNSQALGGRSQAARHHQQVHDRDTWSRGRTVANPQ